MGFIVLGTSPSPSQGMSGGVIQMINHGVSTGALFLLVGMDLRAAPHPRDRRARAACKRSRPVMAAVFTVVMLSSIGLPGLNGFVGEFLVLIGSFGPHRWWAVVATTGVVLAAVYLLWAYQRVFHGVPEGENAKMLDLNLREKLVMVPLLLLIVGMGVYPKPVLDRINPSVDRLVHHVRAATDGEVEVNDSSLRPRSRRNPDCADDGRFDLPAAPSRVLAVVARVHRHRRRVVAAACSRR